MIDRRVLVAVLAALVAGAAVWVIFFRDSDEERIRAALARSALAVAVSEDDRNPIVRAARIRGVFKETVDPAAHVGGEDPPIAIEGRDALADHATALASMFRDCAIDLSGLEVTIQPDGATANVKGRATLVGTDTGRTKRRDARAFSALMRKSDRWRVLSVTVWPPEESR